MNVIVPIMVVVLCVIIAIIIACILIHKRRRHSDKSTGGGSPDHKSVKPGAPVIFASELEDNGGSASGSAVPATRPLIGANGERVPAPPNYLAATSQSPPVVHDHRRPLLSDPAVEQMSPLHYQPPPGTAVNQPGVHSSSRR